MFISLRGRRLPEAHLYTHCHIPMALITVLSSFPLSMPLNWNVTSLTILHSFLTESYHNLALSYCNLHLAWKSTTSKASSTHANAAAVFNTSYAGQVMVLNMTHGCPHVSWMIVKCWIHGLWYSRTVAHSSFSWGFYIFPWVFNTLSWSDSKAFPTQYPFH